jgi:RNase adapter protein RapZ
MTNLTPPAPTMHNNQAAASTLAPVLAPVLELVLITGVSGSGKSVALTALEDSGFFCVDNLPPELLGDFVSLQREQQARKVAVAIDARSASGLPTVPLQLKSLRANGVALTSVFLEATTEALVRRFSETRRMHPLSTVASHASSVGTAAGDAAQQPPTQRRLLTDAIELERELLSELREQAHVVDTSQTSAANLRSHIKALIGHSAQNEGLQLMFESFAFKRGLPMDADFVFDVRMLPNPHYEPALKAQTGLDQGVIDYLSAQPAVHDMAQHITQFLQHWLPTLQSDHRAYVTVAIGCTGGQHRSVYVAQTLSRAFAPHWHTQVRHRELSKLATQEAPA